MLTLNEIGSKYDTDKVEGLHDFLHFYDRRLSPFRQDSFNMFEVGVLRGGSLNTWGEYFPQALVVGIDITPDCKRFETGNKKVRIGNSADPAFLFSLVQEFGAPKIFLDDGSHRWDHQIETLKTMFPLLVPGGMYII